jgi:light-regulated signal transduction histidine kinase (bacteriophytochrome)
MYRTMQLEETNKHLQLVNENLNQFAYIASHDLQEPLRKINIFSDMLMRKSHASLDHSGRLYLEKISGSAKRMSSLIRDLLEFSKLESKEKQFVSVDLNKVINRIKSDYELLINEKRATLHISDLCTIEAIPLQMNQLFYNLIGNAMKFSRKNTSPIIEISSRMVPREKIDVYPGLERNWDYAEIIVQDNGIGFHQNFADQIFIIFQRLHVKEQYEGTGIGLALCKKIIDNHQGKIFAKSEEDSGSSFHVILPVTRS